MHKLCVIHLLISDRDSLFELGNPSNTATGIVDCFGESISTKAIPTRNEALKIDL